MTTEATVKRVHFEDPEPKKLKIEDNLDVYDYLGRNVSVQERRQDAMPWIKVRYHRGKLFMSSDKKKMMENEVYLW